MSTLFNEFILDAQDNLERLSDKISCFIGSKILLTGAAGFLGSHFCHFFSCLNDELNENNKIKVYALDNFIRGKPLWIDSFLKRDDFEIIDTDIIKTKTYPSVDYVIHAASVASPIFYRKKPIETMDANVVGLRNLLDHVRNSPCKSFLYFSTSEIYGDPDVLNIPTKEDYRGYVSSIGPRASYDESKRYGETLCVNFFKQFDVPVKIVRPFNNYGPGMSLNDGRVVSDFFQNILKNQNLELFSDGKSTRTFCYVADAINAYLLVLLSKYDGHVFNVGNPKPEISIEDLAKKIIEITNTNLVIKKIKSTDIEYLTDNPKRRCPDINKISKMLGFKPLISLEKGLLKSYRFYLENFKGLV